MAIAAISTSPVGTEGTSLSRYVAQALSVLEARADELGLQYELGPMFTTLEGSPEAIFTIAQEMHEALFAAGAPRVGTIIRIDDRRDRPSSRQGKIRSVRVKMEELRAPEGVEERSERSD